jgi:sialic acid synthase SpsE
MNIIAEFCQNHLGKLEILESQILKAKIAGAKYGKIQGLYSHELVKRTRFEGINDLQNSSSQIVRPFDSEYNRLKTLDLTLDNEKWFVKRCREVELIPMITVFTHDGVNRALEAGFTNFKIASYDCASIPLIKRLLPHAETLIISTGATYWSEILETAKFIQKNNQNSSEIAFLHATTIYPTKIEELSMLRMLALKIFGFKVGYSDHTMPSSTGLFASKLAILFGADFIERHFTVLAKDKTKDGIVSINEKELNTLVEFSMYNKSEQTELILKKYGSFYTQAIMNTNINPTEVEVTNRDYYRGRVASTLNGKVINSWEDYE